MRKIKITGDILLVAGVAGMAIPILFASRHQETILGVDWLAIFTIGFIVFAAGVIISDLARRWQKKIGS